MWFVETLNITPTTQIATLTFTIKIVQLDTSALALNTAALIAEPDTDTLLWLAAVTAGVALGASLGCARSLLGGQESETVAARVVVGSIAVAASAVLCLGLLGVAGVPAFIAAGLLAILTAHA